MPNRHGPGAHREIATDVWGLRTAYLVSRFCVSPQRPRSVAPDDALMRGLSRKLLTTGSSSRHRRCRLYTLPDRARRSTSARSFIDAPRSRGPCGQAGSPGPRETYCSAMGHGGEQVPFTTSEKNRSANAATDDRLRRTRAAYGPRSGSGALGVYMFPQKRA